MSPAHPWSRALVSGSARGIGRAFAEPLHADGVAVLGVDRLDQGPSGMERTIADLSTREGRADAAKDALAHRPELAVLCAGIASRPPFVDGERAIDEAVVGVNLAAVLAVLQASLPSIVARRGAAVLLSSMSAHQPNVLLPLYGATKWALAVFGRSLQQQLAGRATITVVYPGVARTAIWSDQRAEPASIVPERFWATPDDIARSALEAAAARRAVVVPGRAYRALAPVVECMPQRLGARMAAAAEGARSPAPRPVGTTARARSMAVVGDDPSTVRSLIATARDRGMDVTVAGRNGSPVGHARHLDVDLTTASGRRAAAQVCAEATIVVVTTGRSEMRWFEDSTLEQLEAEIDGSIPAVLEVTRALMRSDDDRERTVILAADESGMVGDAARPVTAGIAAFVLRLGTSLAIEAAATSCRVAAATGSLRSDASEPGERVLAGIDRGLTLAYGGHPWDLRGTQVGRAVRRRWRAR